MWSFVTPISFFTYKNYRYRRTLSCCTDLWIAPKMYHPGNAYQYNQPTDFFYGMGIFVQQCYLPTVSSGGFGYGGYWCSLGGGFGSTGNCYFWSSVFFQLSICSNQLLISQHFSNLNDTGLGLNHNDYMRVAIS